MRRALCAFDRFMTRYFSQPAISWREAFAIVLPLVAEQVLARIMALIYASMISVSGVKSLAAVTLMDTLNAFLNVFYLGIATGASIVIANYRGTGDEKRLHAAATQAITTITGVSILTAAVVLLFQDQILQTFFGSAEAEVLEKAGEYLTGCMLSLPFLAFTTAVSCVLRGISEGKNALQYTIGGSLLFVLTNILFLNVLDMGITGLVLSLLVSRIAGIFLQLLLMKLNGSRFHYRLTELFWLDPEICRGIFRVGVPVVVESMFFQGGLLILSSIIVTMGTEATVIYNVSYAIMQMTQVLVAGTSTALYTIVGICIGADRREDVRPLTRSFFILNTVLYSIVLMLFPLYFPFLLSLYHPTPEIVHDIYVCSLITTVAQPIVHNAAFMLSYVFRSSGNGSYCTVSSLIIMWGVRLVSTKALGTWLGFGIIGAWCGLAVDWVTRAILYSFHYKRGRWLTRSVIPK